MDTIKEALTFDDVLLLPRYSNVLPSNTNIFLQLTRRDNWKQHTIINNCPRNATYNFLLSIRYIEVGLLNRKDPNQDK